MAKPVGHLVIVNKSVGLGHPAMTANGKGLELLGIFSIKVQLKS